MLVSEHRRQGNRAVTEGDDGRRKRARVAAWLLASLVLAIYVGFIGVNAIKSLA